MTSSTNNWVLIKIIKLVGITNPKFCFSIGFVVAFCIIIIEESALRRFEITDFPHFREIQTLKQDFQPKTLIKYHEPRGFAPMSLQKDCNRFRKFMT